MNGKLLKGCLGGCAVLVVLLVVAGAAGTAWVRSTFFSPAPPTPKIGKSVAHRPVFLVRGRDPLIAGTAFGARLRPGGPPLLLTALHLLGPSGGMDRQLTPADVKRDVRQVMLVPFGQNRPTVIAGPALLGTGQALDDATGAVDGDVSAFALPPKGRLNALTLASKNPGMGEHVWIVGDEVTSATEAQRQYHARVVGSDARSLSLMLDSRWELQGFSGAPVINARAEVVGILIGGGTRSAICNPVESIRKHLKNAGIS